MLSATEKGVLDYLYIQIIVIYVFLRPDDVFSHVSEFVHDRLRHVEIMNFFPSCAYASAKAWLIGIVGITTIVEAKASRNRSRTFSSSIAITKSCMIKTF